jgi:hypothetical protein
MTEKSEIEPDDPASYLVTGKALEQYFKLNDALREFSRLIQEEKNERAAAIVGAAFLDTLLEHILISFLADDEKEVQRLLEPEGPLGTYGARVRVVYCLGLISKIIRDDLRLVGKIRNKFAHHLHASFEDEQIRSWCLALKWHEHSMFMKAPEGAMTSDIFQVGVNQLVAHLNGIPSIARREKRKIQSWGS